MPAASHPVRLPNVYRVSQIETLLGFQNQRCSGKRFLLRAAPRAAASLTSYSLSGLRLRFRLLEPIAALPPIAA